jgi:hypothetical protein
VGIYVSATGNDTYPGTYDAPLKTLNDAVNKAAITTHKTVYVKGTLTGDTKKVSGGAGYSSFVVINKALPSATVTIKGIENGILMKGTTSKYRVLEIRKSSIRIESLTITGGDSAAKGGGILVHDESTLQLGNGALITGNNTNMGGGGVYVYDESALYMEAGSNISGNTAKEWGGGLAVRDHSIATINGGIIDHNMTNDPDDGGGGVGVYYYSEVILNSGEIHSNESINDGGGVYVHDIATFTMNGGSIHNNKTTETGGGVCLAWSISKFKMIGGEIYSNETTGTSSLCSGGGVAREVSGTKLFEKTGGTIYGTDVPAKANKSSRGFSHAYAFYEAVSSKDTANWSDATLYGSLTK